MHDSPQVSVCVPVYNGETYLVACLDGIRRQTFRDFEVVVVDDGSSDRTLDVVRSFAFDGVPVRIERNETNRGLVGNWNRCIELARGRWIKFVFQDDLVDPRCLERMVAAGEAAGVDLVACRRTLALADDTPDTLRRWYARHEAMLASVYAGRPVVGALDYCRARLEHLGYNIVGEPIATLIRRHAFERWGLFSPLLVQLCDAELFDRIATNGGIAYVDEPLATFRVHGGSESRRNLRRRFRGGVLEDLSFLYALAHAPAFEALRGAARRLGKGGLIEDRLQRCLHEARDRLRWADGSGDDAAAMRAEFDALLAELPRLRSRPLHYLLFRLQRRLGRAADPFAAEAA